YHADSCRYALVQQLQQIGHSFNLDEPSARACAEGRAAARDDVAGGPDLLVRQHPRCHDQPTVARELLEFLPRRTLQVRYGWQYHRLVAGFTDLERAVLDRSLRQEQRVQIIVRSLGSRQLAHEACPVSRDSLGNRVVLEAWFGAMRPDRRDRVE